jgi:hypothetical protein
MPYQGQGLSLFITIKTALIKGFHDFILLSFTAIYSNYIEKHIYPPRNFICYLSKRKSIMFNVLIPSCDFI